MLTKVQAWIDGNRLLRRGGTVVAACSGGPDSLALVCVLKELSAKYDVTIVVAHVDHMFRGEASAADARFVADFCRGQGLVCRQAAINVPEFMARSGQSAQEAARLLRYRFLRQVAGEFDGAKIATGHHQGDQAETVLIHLLRGAGGDGLGGMKPMERDIIRPLLPVTREEIQNYCRAHALEPRHDGSNDKDCYLRNRIRLRLMPLLEEEYNPALPEALCRTADIIRAEHEYVRQMAAASLEQAAAQRDNGDWFVATVAMVKLPLALRREIIRRIIEKKQGSLKGISFYHVEKILDVLFTGKAGCVFRPPGGLLVCKEYGGILLGSGSSRSAKRRIEPPGVRLRIPGIVIVPVLGYEIECRLIPAGQPSPPASAEIAVFDWQVLQPPLFVRTRQPGDRFHPRGMQGSKKLKAYFIDEKIPWSERDEALVFYDAREIVWLGRYRQAEYAKSDDDSVERLCISIRYSKDEIKHDSEYYGQ